MLGARTNNSDRHQGKCNDRFVLHERVLSTAHAHQVRHCTTAHHCIHHLRTTRVFDQPRYEAVRFTWQQQRQTLALPTF